MCTDRPPEILQLVRIRVVSISLGSRGGGSGYLYLGFDGGRNLPLAGYFWLAHSHAPIDKEIIFVVWNRTCGCLLIGTV